MEAKYTQVIAHQEAIDTRLNAFDRLSASGTLERASIRDRLTTLEAQISPVVVTSNIIEKFGSHLGALDGRSDTFDRNLLAEQKLRADQIAGLCAKLAGIAGASGKRPLTCP